MYRSLSYKADLKNAALSSVKQTNTGNQNIEQNIADFISNIDSTLSTEETQILRNNFLNSPRRYYSKDIILCLTIRKISNRKKERLKKYSFYLIRSLYKETRSKKPKSRRHFQIPKLLISKRNSKGLKFQAAFRKILSRKTLKYFNNWRANRSKNLDSFLKPAKLLEKLERLQKSVIFHEILLSSLKIKLEEKIKIFTSSLKTIINHRVYIGKLSALHLLKIIYFKARKTKPSTLFCKLLIKNKKKTVQSYFKYFLFSAWYSNMVGIRTLVYSRTFNKINRKVSCEDSLKSCSPRRSGSTSRRYASDAVNFIPVPTSIHDYIDDMVDISKRDSEYFYLTPRKYLNSLYY